MHYWEKFHFSVGFGLVCLLTVILSLANNGIHALEERDCEPDPYCKGKNFPAVLQLQDRDVQCNQVPRSRDRCCLPRLKHLICYDIKVHGDYLNYNVENHSRNTDFSGLCTAMARKHGNHTTGKRSMVITANIGGGMIWKHGEWGQFPARNETIQRHIKHLACEVLRF